MERSPLTAPRCSSRRRPSTRSGTRCGRTMQLRVSYAARVCEHLMGICKLQLWTMPGSMPMMYPADFRQQHGQPEPQVLASNGTLG